MKTEETNDSIEESTGESAPILYEGKGRKFHDTAEGREQLKQFLDGLSESAGKNAQKNGDLLKENRSLKQRLAEIQGTSSSSEWDAIINDDEADPSIKKLALISKQREESRTTYKRESEHQKLFADISSLVIQNVPELGARADEDVVEAVLRQHSKTIETAANPLDEAIAIVSKKFKLERADKTANDHPSLGVRPAASPSGSSKKASDKKPDAKSLLKGLGYK